MANGIKNPPSIDELSNDPNDILRRFRETLKPSKKELQTQSELEALETPEAQEKATGNQMLLGALSALGQGAAEFGRQGAGAELGKQLDPMVQAAGVEGQKSKLQAALDKLKKQRQVKIGELGTEADMMAKLTPKAQAPTLRSYDSVNESGEKVRITERRNPATGEVIGTDQVVIGKADKEDYAAAAQRSLDMAMADPRAKRLIERSQGSFDTSNINTREDLLRYQQSLRNITGKLSGLTLSRQDLGELDPIREGRSNMKLADALLKKLEKSDAASGIDAAKTTLGDFLNKYTGSNEIEPNSDFIRLRQVLGLDFASFVKSISGAQVSEKEFTRLSQTRPLPTDSYAVARAKLDFLNRFMDYKHYKKLHELVEDRGMLVSDADLEEYNDLKKKYKSPQKMLMSLEDEEASLPKTGALSKKEYPFKKGETKDNVADDMIDMFIKKFPKDLKTGEPMTREKAKEILKKKMGG